MAAAASFGFAAGHGDRRQPLQGLDGRGRVGVDQPAEDGVGPGQLAGPQEQHRQLPEPGRLANEVGGGQGGGGPGDVLQAEVGVDQQRQVLLGPPRRRRGGPASRPPVPAGRGWRPPPRSAAARPGRGRRRSTPTPSSAAGSASPRPAGGRSIRSDARWASDVVRRGPGRTSSGQQAGWRRACRSAASSASTTGAAAAGWRRARPAAWRSRASACGRGRRPAGRRRMRPAGRRRWRRVAAERDQPAGGRHGDVVPAERRGPACPTACSPAGSVGGGVEAGGQQGVGPVGVAGRQQRRGGSPSSHCGSSGWRSSMSRQMAVASSVRPADRAAPRTSRTNRSDRTVPARAGSAAAARHHAEQVGHAARAPAGSVASGSIRSAGRVRVGRARRRPAAAACRPGGRRRPTGPARRGGRPGGRPCRPPR